MRDFSTRFSTFLLAFAVGTALTGVLIFKTQAKQIEAIVEPPEINDVEPKRKTLEMVFVLDTTGSMGGLIDGAKQKIWSIGLLRSF